MAEDDDARVPDAFEIRTQQRRREVLRPPVRDIVFVELDCKFLSPEHEIEPVVVRDQLLLFHLRDLYAESGQTLQGSFLAVSKPKFASTKSKY